MSQQIMVPMVKIEVKGSKDALYINPTSFIAIEYCAPDDANGATVHLTLATQQDTMEISGERAEAFMTWFRRFMGESPIAIPQLNSSRLKIT
jgi:hypothetical protein